MTLAQAMTDTEREVLQKSLHALQHAAGHLSAVDVSNAEANLAVVRYRPLTQHCIEAATVLGDLLGALGASFPTEENVGEVRGEVFTIH